MTGEQQVSFTDVLDWLEGRLSDPEADRVARAVAEGDPAVQRTVEWVRGFLAHTRAHRLHSPPPSVRDALVQAFADRAGGAAVPRRVVPALVFDSRRDTELVGVRSATAGEATQLAWSSDELDVVVDVSSAPDGAVLVSGQVLPQGDWPAVGYVVTVQAAGVDTAPVPVDDVGLFRCPVSEGAPERIVVGNDEIHLVLDLGSG